MPTFIAIGYGDQSGYERTERSVRDRAHAHDEQLLKDGAIMGPASEPVQIRNTQEGHVQRTSGAFMTSPLPVAGFTILEADSLEQAISLVAKTPCAVAHGVVEVWPIEHAGSWRAVSTP